MGVGNLAGLWGVYGLGLGFGYLDAASTKKTQGMAAREAGLWYAALRDWGNEEMGMRWATVGQPRGYGEGGVSNGLWMLGGGG